MQQGFLTTILTLLLYFTSLGGGELPQSSDQGAEPAPSWTEDLSSSQSQPAILTGKAVNIRSGPGSEYPLIATLEGGTMVNLEATSLGWGKVRTGDGKVGWVPMWLVSTSEFDLKNAAPAAPQNKGQRRFTAIMLMPALTDLQRLSASCSLASSPSPIISQPKV